MIPKIAHRFVRFGLVGATGVVVNMGLLVLLTEVFGVPYIISSLFAIEASILSNFALNNAWTWADTKAGPFWPRLMKYHAVAGVTALAGNWMLLIFLTKVFGLDYRVANLIGIGAGVVLNFALNHVWTFRSAGAPGTGLAYSRLLAVVIATVLLLTGAKAYLAATVELFPEEAYYWTYLQHPSLSYFDHPPMVAWVIGFGTTLFGDTEFGVRFGTLLLSLGATVWMFLLARLWFSETCACWAALLLNLLPIFVGIGLLAFPDGPLVFFWLLTLYAISKALKTDNRIHANLFWLLAGLAFGGALLSKYTAVMLAVSLGLFLLISRTYRVWLRRPQPWLALMIGLAVFTPVIVWNAHHEWASFLFQSNRTEDQREPMLRTVPEFWLVQLGILGPLPFVLLALAAIGAVKRGWRAGDDRWSFALSFFLPLFAVFVWASFKTEVHINWTVPAFLSLVMAGAAVFQEGIEIRTSRLARLWRWAGWSTVALSVVATVGGISTIRWGKPALFTPSRMGGWKELSILVEAAEKRLEHATGEKPFVLGADKYNLAAELSFYTREPEDNINNLALGKHGLGFRYWKKLESLEGLPAVAVVTKTDRSTMASLEKHFESVDSPRPIALRTLGNRTRTMWLVDCYGYKRPKL